MTTHPRLSPALMLSPTPLRHVLAILAALVLLGASPSASTAAAPARHRGPATHAPVHKRPAKKKAKKARAAPLPVPAGFVGMNLNGPLFRTGDGISLADQMANMVRAGVQTIRVTFSWQDAQPYRTRPRSRATR